MRSPRLAASSTKRRALARCRIGASRRRASNGHTNDVYFYRCIWYIGYIRTRTYNCIKIYSVTANNKHQQAETIIKPSPSASGNTESLSHYISCSARISSHIHTTGVVHKWYYPPKWTFIVRKPPIIGVGIGVQHLWTNPTRNILKYKQP